MSDLVYKMPEGVSDLTLKITEEVTETEENFIFTTINPWCENVMQRKISKCDLERALTLYFNGGSILDKIRAEIEEKYDGYDICEWFEDYDYEENDISEYRSVGDVSDILAIIDKYKAESEVGNESI